MSEIVTSHRAVRMLNSIEQALLHVQSRRSDKVSPFLDMLHKSGFTVIEDAAAVNAPTMTHPQSELLTDFDESGRL